MDNTDFRDLERSGIGILPWKAIITFFLMFDIIIDLLIHIWQKNTALKVKPPAALENVVPRETVVRSSSYEVEKIALRALKKVLLFAADLTMIFGDWYAVMWMYAGLALQYLPGSHLVSQTTAQSIVFVLEYLLLIKALELPLDAFKTFYVERSHVSNNQTVLEFLLDFAKESLLLVLLAPLPLAILLNVATLAGNQLILYVWPTWIIIQFVLATISPMITVPFLNKLSPLQDGPLKAKIEELVKKQGFPLKGLYVMDDSTQSSDPKAFFYGFPWQMRIVLHDTLLKQFEDDEIVAVVAQELGHWKYGHQSRLLSVAQIDSFIRLAMFSYGVRDPWLYWNFGLARDRPFVVGFLVFSKFLSPINVFLQLIVNTVSRRFEKTADRFAMGLGYEARLGDALVKMECINLSATRVNWLYGTFYRSRPTVSSRLDALGWRQEKER